MINFDPDKKVHKTQIQAEFYHLCRLNDIPCKLNYQVGNKNISLLIYRGESPICAIRVESTTGGSRKNSNDTREYFYRSLGIPYYYIGHMREIPEILAEIKKFF